MTYAGERDNALIRVCDLAGRPRGTGFLADTDGTMITSHEAVDGLARLVLHAPGGRVCLAEAAAITPLPEHGVALVATEGLGLPPLPIATGGPAHPEQRIRLRLPHRAEGSVIGTTAVTYTATDRFHLLDEVYELALDRADLSRAAAQASGAPLIDAATGAVLAVVVTALQAEHRASGFAVPLRAAGAPAPLAGLLARNAATVPGYGPHLNLAGALRLTGTTLGPAGEPADRRHTVARPELVGAPTEFLAAEGEERPLVLGLVGAPGTGRSTELARLATSSARGSRPAPTLWLRGAELRPGDGSVRDAIERSLRAATRIVRAATGDAPAEVLLTPPPPCARHGEPGGYGGYGERREPGGALGDCGRPGEYGGDTSPDTLADLARSAGRPLLVLLDEPEEMPPVLAHELAGWAAATAQWLRASGTRLILACGTELWERIEAALPAAAAKVAVGELTTEQAAHLRARHHLPDGALAAADAAHPLALRLLAEVRAALPGDTEPDPAEPPSRADVFSAHLDLMCLRIAERLAAGSRPPLRGTGVRRLAARVAGQTHEAARRLLGPGQGALDREAFEELFPWRSGWAAAVLTEGLLVPAGAGYRFAHEEQADWLQSLHLDLDAALHALVHRWFVPPSTTAEAAVRLPARSAARAGHPPPVPPAPPIAPAGFPRSLPVPRHRAGPVRQALLAAPPAVRAAHLRALLQTLDRHTPPPTRLAMLPNPHRPTEAGPAAATPDTAATVPTPHPARTRPVPGGGGRRQADAVWWAAHLVRETLTRAPDPDLLRDLAGRVVVRAVERGGFAADLATDAMGPLGRFGPSFWRALPLPVTDRLELLRLLLPADGPPTADRADDRFLTAASDLFRANPAAALPAVCGWLTDDRPLQTAPGAPGASGSPHPARLTVASAAQALLHTHRRLAVDDLTEALVAVGQPAADEVLAALAEDEPSAVCRAVDRWAHDERPDRHVAAATHGPAAAPHVRSAADRELLRYAALAILGRPQDRALHGAALALLVRDPVTRDGHLPAALAKFTVGDPDVTPAALGTALATHPDSVLAAFRARLRGPVASPPEPGPGESPERRLPAPRASRSHDPRPDRPEDRTGGRGGRSPDPGFRPGSAGDPTTAAPGGSAGILAELATVRGQALARRAATLVEEYLRRRPAAAPEVARFLDARLETGEAARATLLPLVRALLRDHPTPVRRLLLPVFADPGTPGSRALRFEVLDLALGIERDPAVLDALLTAAAAGCRRRHPLLTRDLVHRLGLLLGRTPEGATHFDRRVVELAAAQPDFGRLLRAWLTDGGSWDAVVGPSARRRLDTVA